MAFEDSGIVFLKLIMLIFFMIQPSFPFNPTNTPTPLPAIYGCTAHVSLSVLTCMYIKCRIHALVHVVCAVCMYGVVWIVYIVCTWRSLCCKYTTIYKIGHVPYYYRFPLFQVWASYPASTQLTNFKLYKLQATCWCFSFTFCP